MFLSPYSSVATIAAGLTCLGLLVGFGISHNSHCHHSVSTDPATIITHDDDSQSDTKMADKARSQEMNGHADDDDDGDPATPDDDSQTSTAL